MRKKPVAVIATALGVAFTLALANAENGPALVEKSDPSEQQQAGQQADEPASTEQDTAPGEAASKQPEKRGRQDAQAPGKADDEAPLARSCVTQDGVITLQGTQAYERCLREQQE